MNYKVVASIKPRKTPSMWETVTETILPTGYLFTSDTSATLVPTPPITGQTGPITWIRLPDMYWVPMVYKGITYVVSLAPAPTGVPYSLSVEGYKTATGVLEPEL